MYRHRFAGAAIATAALVLGLAYGVCADATPRGVSYVPYDRWGGSWWDAEKSPLTPEDDLLCWAATAANILVWTGWSGASGMTTNDQIMLYYRNHWTNAGGLMDYGWDWWFDGTNPSQGWSGWSQVDVPGGGFYPAVNMYDYYHEQWTQSLVLSSIDSYLHAGYGVGLALYGSGGHAVTCWGYSYDAASPSTYYGVWITDSDDDKYVTSPPDRLRYYDVAYSGGRWYLQNYYGTSNVWYIGGVEALSVIPEPMTLVTLLAGIGAMIGFRRRVR